MLIRRAFFLATLAAAAVPLLADEPSKLDILVQVLGKMESPESQANILRGMKASLQGQRGVPEPKGWAEIYAKLKNSPDEGVRADAQAIAVIFGGGAAMDEMRAKLLDAGAPAEQRRQALETLVAQRDAGSLDALLKLAVEPGPLREPALRGLAGFDDPRIAPALVGAYAKLGTAERRAAVQALLARPSGAQAFLAAIDGGQIPKADLTAPLVRQLQGLKNPDFDAWLTKNWGAVKEVSADKKAMIAKFKEFLSPEAILRADANHGRALFTQTCAVCHTLFGTGGHIGPELTGGYEDVDYLLNNVLDPNAIIGKDYQQTFVKMKDGQVLAGIVTQETDSAISLKTLSGEIVTAQKSDVAGTEISPQSMMPEGLLLPLQEEDVRDLFLYLRGKEQVPMLITAVNATDFFNGTDLHNWAPAPEGAWKVEQGELVGRSNGKPVALASEMTAGDYRLTAQVRVTGEKAAAELVLSGARDAGKFHGATLSFGGPSRVNLWTYLAAAEAKSQPGEAVVDGAGWHTLEVVRKDNRLQVSVDGRRQFETDDLRHRRHVQPALWLRDGELRVKGLKVEAL